MDRPTPRPLSPFEKFIAAIAQVPKAEVDAQQVKRETKPGKKRKMKPVA